MEITTAFPLPPAAFYDGDEEEIRKREPMVLPEDVGALMPFGQPLDPTVCMAEVSVDVLRQDYHRLHGLFIEMLDRCTDGTLQEQEVRDRLVSGIEEHVGRMQKAVNSLRHQQVRVGWVGRV